jgi:hypothetical protein
LLAIQVFNNKSDISIDFTERWLTNSSGMNLNSGAKRRWPQRGGGQEPGITAEGELPRGSFNQI